MPINIELMNLENEERLTLFTQVFLDLMIYGFELITRGSELVTQGFELVTREFELITRGSELVTCEF